MANDPVDELTDQLGNVRISDTEPVQPEPVHPELAQPDPAQEVPMVNPTIPDSPNTRDTHASTSGTVSTNLSTPVSLQSLSPRGNYQKIENNRRVPLPISEVVRTSKFNPKYSENFNKAEWVKTIITELSIVYQVHPSYVRFLGEDKFIDNILRFLPHDFYTLEEYLTVRAAHGTIGSKEETVADIVLEMESEYRKPHSSCDFDYYLGQFDSSFDISLSSSTGEKFIKVMNGLTQRTLESLEIHGARLYSHCWYYRTMKAKVEREARRQRIILKPMELQKLVLQDNSVVLTLYLSRVLDLSPSLNIDDIDRSVYT